MAASHHSLPAHHLLALTSCFAGAFQKSLTPAPSSFSSFGSSFISIFASKAGTSGAGASSSRSSWPAFPPSSQRLGTCELAASGSIFEESFYCSLHALGQILPSQNHHLSNKPGNVIAQLKDRLLVKNLHLPSPCQGSQPFLSSHQLAIQPALVFCRHTDLQKSA